MRKPKQGLTLEQSLHRIKEIPGVLRYQEDPKKKLAVVKGLSEGWNWDDSRHRSSHYGWEQPEDLWAAIKFERSVLARPTGLVSPGGKVASVCLLDSIFAELHFVDRQLAHPMHAGEPNIDSPLEKQRHILASLREEAIASSQIEGAATTRQHAKRMLQENRPPRTLDETMIRNNYLALSWIKEQRRRPLDLPMLCELQRLLTAGTNLAEEKTGRLRATSDRIAVVDAVGDELYEPPSAALLPNRLQVLFDFANRPLDGEDGAFWHPVMRAIILHFWLAYEHPFVDGNGRTARALFMWSLLRDDYRLVEYLAISKAILERRIQYGQAFLDVEHDELDLTYFVKFHLKVLRQSIDSFREYVERKKTERERVGNILRTGQFNDRQRDIIERALADPLSVFTFAAESSRSNVTEVTARSDLKELEEQGLLRGNRKGRRFEFVAINNLEKRLRELAARIQPDDSEEP